MLYSKFAPNRTVNLREYAFLFIAEITRRLLKTALFRVTRTVANGEPVRSVNQTALGVARVS